MGHFISFLRRVSLDAGRTGVVSPTEFQTTCRLIVLEILAVMFKFISILVCVHVCAALRTEIQRKLQADDFSDTATGKFEVFVGKQALVNECGG